MFIICSLLQQSGAAFYNISHVEKNQNHGRQTSLEGEQECMCVCVCVNMSNMCHVSVQCMCNIMCVGCVRMICVCVCVSV